MPGNLDPMRRWLGEPRRLDDPKGLPEARGCGAQEATDGPPETRGRAAREAAPPSLTLVTTPAPTPGTNAKGLPLSLASALSAIAADGCAGSLVHNTFIHAKMPPLTPASGARRSSSVPKDTGSRRHAFEVAALAPAALLEPRRPAAGAVPRRAACFCPDEPLSLEEALGVADAGAPPAAASPVPLVRTPKDSHVKLVVRNTFLHSAPVPPTPAPHVAARRSSSGPPLGAAAAAAVVLAANAAGGSGEAPRQAARALLRVLPRLLGGAEGLALSPGCRRKQASVAMDALPAFVPVSPAPAASPFGRSGGSSGGWFAFRPGAGAPAGH